MTDNKKINRKEISETDLYKIHGGSTEEIFYDNCFLKQLGVTQNYWGYVDFLFDDSKGAAIAKEWEKVGVTCVFDPAGDNRYYIKEGMITRPQALEYAKKFLGKDD